MADRLSKQELWICVIIFIYLATNLLFKLFVSLKTITCLVSFVFCISGFLMMMMETCACESDSTVHCFCLQQIK